MNNGVKIVAVVNGSEKDNQGLKDAISACLNESIKEEGCLEYLAYGDTENPGRFVFVEHWRSEEALSLHMNTTYLKRLADFFASVEATVEIMRLAPVA